MYAVIKTGGKQYRVSPDDVITIERVKGEAGDTVEFAQVLMLAGDGGITLGAPFIAGATVAAELVAQTRGERIIIFKKKRRHHYRRRNGHRQDLTEVKITEILTDGKKPEKKAKPAPEKAKDEPAKEPKRAKKTAPEEKVETSKAAEAAPEKKAVKPKAESGKAAADDLSQIAGIGPVIVKKLAGEGITSLSQVAELTPERIAELDEKLALRGRIGREEWIEQAKDLLAGKSPRAKAERKAHEDKSDDKQEG